ncbi:hypothetical protein BDFB_011279 [Asbolus verrucosus]|uniref:Chitin deacetylase n=1 Tax=Asbolus verrucosus TaxID=1661398 RepID=A0A482VL40_ASBVE|nr:hypothetical protein BDFB_011279 [Asbolus verrucosus]
MKVVILLCLSIILDQANSLQAAEKCSPDTCTISNNCRCSSTTSPLLEGDAPQLIALTIDEALQNRTFNDFWEPLFFDRKNPDGNPISATFFVPHEFTDYKRVNDLYLRGFEIADGSVTRNASSEYWKNASIDTLTQEFEDMRTIISTFANISIDDIIGARTPQLQLQGDNSIDAYIASGIQYDNSWTSRSTSHLFPYTLDYLSSQACRQEITCPTESHPGFWIAPIINIQGKGNIECNSLITCFYDGTADEIAAWLHSQVNATNKAPVVLMISSNYFLSVENSVEGFQKFLDGLGSDTFLVSVKQIIDWVKNPVPANEFQTEVPERTAECNNPTLCQLTKQDDGTTVYMESCAPCPDVFPWLGNPLGSLTSNSMKITED